MNQTPHLPPNEPEPLDEAERDLARMLGTLPSGSPPPDLDARILGAARRAVQQVRPRQLNWWRSVGLGTAASALLAVGLFVKMHGAEQGAPVRSAATADAEADRMQAAAPESSAHAATPSVLAPLPPPKEAQPIVESPAPPPMSVASPPPPAPIDAPAQRAGEDGAMADKAAASAFPSPQKTESQSRQTIAITPAPMSPAVVNEAGRAAGYAPPAPPSAAPPPPPAEDRAETKADAYAAPRRDAGSAAAAAAVDKRQLDKDEQPAAAKSAPTVGGSTNAIGQLQAQEVEKSKELDSISVGGSRTRHSAPEGNSATLSLDDDARLAPAQWLARIRDRLGAGDEARARDSLHRFHLRYPDTAIPDDLQPLLR